VSDPVTTSKTAREGLARGLNALQGDPTVPPQLMELAAPIAQAMGALHQIEKSSQLVPHAEVALNHVRGALAKLQAQPPTHPAVAAALEAVAGSLSLVHQLGKMANGPAAGPPQVAPNTAAMPQKAPQQQMHQPPPQQMHQPPMQQMHQPPMQQHQPSFPQAGPHQGPPPGGPGMVARDPFAAPAPQGGPPPGFHGHPQGPPQGARPAPVPGAPVPAPPAGNLQVIPADLGAHSPTNFYKGLSGNDIIDHGGLFVSTYVPPKLGTPVRLKVSLPGGYEFEANAVVKWVREQGGDGDAPPGFGAQFTQITPEARQLVYRYVRNREPLFHDDF
jgi:uncharacterized protein (TIGR02266 family)